MASTNMIFLRFLAMFIVFLRFFAIFCDFVSGFFVWKNNGFVCFFLAVLGQPLGGGLAWAHFGSKCVL